MVIPCAGLGSRLGPLTATTPKELLLVGGQPLLHGVMLELQAAGIQQAVVVTSPRKPGIGRFVRDRATVPTALVEQPEPLGVFDAVERARSWLGTDRFIVLFPDYVCLPEQRGLAALITATAGLPDDVSAFGLVRPGAGHGPLGPSASVGGVADGALLRIERVGPAQPAGMHTAFAELRGTEHSRRLRGDGGLTALLAALATEGRLVGCELPGELLDVGIAAGHAEACARFADGRATWRR